MKKIAIIAARSGSMRVKNKNIRPFADSSLLAVKIDQLKRLNLFDDIIINSNDDEILNIGLEKGVSLVKRDPYFASNIVSMSDVYVNIAQTCGGGTMI